MTAFVNINRNLLNYPLARDPRTKLGWYRSEKTGRWLCELPGEDRTLLLFPEDSDETELRCPTAFDVNLLLLLLADAGQRDGPARFSSASSLLRALGVAVDPRHRRLLADALALWSSLSLRFSQWYEIGGERRVKVLPAPIAKVKKANGLRITLDRSWRNLASHGYFTPVPLPLPFKAASQNLTLYLLTASSRVRLEEPLPYGRDRIGPLATRGLCRRIGIDHGARLETLRAAIEAASEWYADHGGSLRQFPLSQRECWFAFTEPHIPKVRATRKRKGRAEPRIRVRARSYRPPSSELEYGYDNDGNAVRMRRTASGDLVDA